MGARHMRQQTNLTDVLFCSPDSEASEPSSALSTSHATLPTNPESKVSDVGYEKKIREGEPDPQSRAGTLPPTSSGNKRQQPISDRDCR